MISVEKIAIFSLAWLFLLAHASAARGSLESHSFQPPAAELSCADQIPFPHTMNWVTAANSDPIVDGDFSDWDLRGDESADWYLNMHRAGKIEKQIESKLYMRASCPTGQSQVTKIFIAVVLEVGVSLATPFNLDDHFIKIDGIKPANFVLVESAAGWEASFDVDAQMRAQSPTELNAHAQVFSDGEEQTSASSNPDGGREVFFEYPTCTSCSLVKQQIYSGNETDLNFNTVSHSAATTAAKCASDCDSNPICSAYTFERYGSQPGRCRLLVNDFASTTALQAAPCGDLRAWGVCNGPPSPSPSTSVAASVTPAASNTAAASVTPVASFAPCENAPMKYEGQVTYTGSTLGNPETQANLASCEAMCQTNPACSVYIHKEDNNLCTLLTQVSYVSATPPSGSEFDGHYGNCNNFPLTPSPSSTPTNSPTTSASMSMVPSQSRAASDSPSRSFSATKSRTPLMSVTSAASITSSNSVTSSMSNTPLPSSTRAASPSAIPSSSRAASSTSAASPSAAASSSGSTSISPLASRSANPSPTAAASESKTPSSTREPTRTPAPSSSTSPSTTRLPSRTPEASRTPSITATPASSATAAPSQTPAPSVSAEPSSSRGASPTSSTSPSPAASTSAAASPSAAASTTAAPSSSRAPSLTPAASITSSPSSSRAPSVTPAASTSAAASVTPAASVTRVPTRTPMPSTTRSGSNSRAPSSSNSISMSNAPSISMTPSTTRSASLTPAISTTNTASPSRSSSVTGTPSRTGTPSVTSSPEPSSSPSTTNSASRTPDASTSRTATASVTRTSSPSRPASQTPSKTARPSAPPHNGICEILNCDTVSANVYTLGDFEGFGSDVEGSLYVGGDAELQAYSVGAVLSDSEGARDDIVVDGTLSFWSGYVPNGNVVYGDENSYVGDPVLNSFNILNTARHEESAFDFSGGNTCYNLQQSGYCMLADTGDVAPEYISNSKLEFFASSTRYDYIIFNLPCGNVQNITELDFNVPAGTTVLINLHQTGGTCKLQFTHSYDPKKILFNSCGANRVVISGHVRGSVLAADAEVISSAGMLDGQLVAGSHSGQLQYNSHTFNGCLPNYQIDWGF